MDIKVQRWFGKKRYGSIFYVLTCTCVVVSPFCFVARIIHIQNPDLTFELWIEGSRFQHPPQGCRFWGAAKPLPKKRKTPPKDRKWSNKKSTLKDETTCFPKIVCRFLFKYTILVLEKRCWWAKIPRRSSGWKFAKCRKWMLLASCATQSSWFLTFSQKSISRVANRVCIVWKWKNSAMCLEDVPPQDTWLYS